MSNFNNQNNMNLPQNYTPLYNDYNIQSNNMIQEPNNIQINIEPEKNGYYTIYKTPYDWRDILLLILFITFFGIIILFTKFFIFDYYYKNTRFISLIGPLFYILICFCYNSDYYILFDPSQKRFIVKEFKIFPFIWKSQIIPINDIQKVMLRKYDGESGNYFNIYFLLANGKKVTVIDTYNEKGKGTRALQALKYFLPQEIFFMDLSSY